MKPYVAPHVDHGRPTPQPRRYTSWQIVGIVCAVVFLIASLAAIAFAVLFMIALASWGSNK